MLDACYYNPCLNGGTCLVGVNNSTACRCPLGYSGNNCEISGTCNSLSCGSGGSCVIDSPGALPRCKCKANFYGKACQFEVNSQLCNSNDKDTNKCATWKSLGYCDFSFTFDDVPVPIYCPNTCGLCRTVLACVDQQPNCALWANLGLCSRINAIDANTCKKSCGNCAFGVSRSLIKIMIEENNFNSTTNTLFNKLKK